jgi:hypothetical protein
MKTVRSIVLAAAAVIGFWPGIAAADPSPAPSPGYQIPGADGPTFPGTQVYPPVCLTAPLACGLRYHADTGTWQPVEDQ